MLKKVTAQELRDRLGEHLDRAYLSGEAFVVTRSRKPRGVLLGPQQYLDLLERLAAYDNGRTPPTRRAPTDPDLVTLDELKRLVS